MSSTKTLSAQFTKAAGTGGRKFTATITTDAIDRDGEVVIPGGMNSKEYETNPVLLYEHDVLKPIGKMVDMRRGDRSIEATFALAPRPEGHTGEWLPDTVGALMEFGALNAMSIGFSGMEARPATKSDLEKFGAGVRRVYSKWKLLEVSVVALPANQDAIINAVSKGLITRDRAQAMGVTVPEAKPQPVAQQPKPQALALPRTPVPVRVKGTHRVTVNVPALGTDDLARITREELARQRGLLYIR